MHHVHAEVFQNQYVSPAEHVGHSFRHERVVRERALDGMGSSSGRQADRDGSNLIKVVHRVITRRQADTDGSKPCHPRAYAVSSHPDMELKL